MVRPKVSGPMMGIELGPQGWSIGEAFSGEWRGLYVWVFPWSDPDGNVSAWEIRLGGSPELEKQQQELENLFLSESDVVTALSSNDVRWVRGEEALGLRRKYFPLSRAEVRRWRRDRRGDRPH